MTKYTKQHLTQAARKLLKSVADQPWGRSTNGALRILNPDHTTVCPLCMIANRKVKAWTFDLDGIEAMREMDWPITREETRRIMLAVDKADHPLRQEVIAALGGVRTADERGNPVVR